MRPDIGIHVALDLCDELVEIEFERRRSDMGPTPTTTVSLEWHEALHLSRELAYHAGRTLPGDVAYRVTLPFGMVVTLTYQEVTLLRLGLRTALSPTRADV